MLNNLVSKLKPLRGTSIHYSPLTIHYYMQNKPNFQKDKTNISTVITKDYENQGRLRTQGKQTQTNPIYSELVEPISNPPLLKWAVTKTKRLTIIETAANLKPKSCLAFRLFLYF